MASTSTMTPPCIVLDVTEQGVDGKRVHVPSKSLNLARSKGEINEVRSENRAK